jgi:hypothetical protein
MSGYVARAASAGARPWRSVPGVRENAAARLARTGAPNAVVDGEPAGWDGDVPGQGLDDEARGVHGDPLGLRLVPPAGRASRRPSQSPPGAADESREGDRAEAATSAAQLQDAAGPDGGAARRRHAGPGDRATTADAPARAVPPRAVRATGAVPASLPSGADPGRAGAPPRGSSGPRPAPDHTSAPPPADDRGPSSPVAPRRHASAAPADRPPASTPPVPAAPAAPAAAARPPAAGGQDERLVQRGGTAAAAQAAPRPIGALPPIAVVAGPLIPPRPLHPPEPPDQAPPAERDGSGDRVSRPAREPRLDPLDRSTAVREPSETAAVAVSTPASAATLPAGPAGEAGLAGSRAPRVTVHIGRVEVSVVHRPAAPRRAPTAASDAGAHPAPPERAGLLGVSAFDRARLSR